MDFTQNKYSAPSTIEKMKILGAVLELPAKEHCQSKPIYLKIGLTWPNRQCCLAGSSKMAPRILIFSIAMGADHSFYVKTIETHSRAFLPLNISAIGTVKCNMHVALPKLPIDQFKPVQ